MSLFQGKGVDMETTDEDGDSLEEVARVMNRDGNFDAILTLLRSHLNNPKGAENFLYSTRFYLTTLLKSHCSRLYRDE